jgi:hypothetical protein
MNSEIELQNINLLLDAGSVSSVSSAASVSSMASLTSGIKRNKMLARKKRPDDTKYNTLLHKRLRKYESY